MINKQFTKRASALLGFFYVCFGIGSAFGAEVASQFEKALAQGPRILVVHEGSSAESNPAHLDAQYLMNLLGHFTTNRSLVSMNDYRAGDWKKYDAVFAVAYEKKGMPPEALLRDAAETDRPFCWLGHQGGNLSRFGALQKHGLAFDRFVQDSPARSVEYHGIRVEKGDPDINLFQIKDPTKVEVIATAIGAEGWSAPYIFRSNNFWIITDSPFSYCTERDRYFVFADVLHDILHANHPEQRRALVRIEDVNPMSEPADLKSMRRLFASQGIPFSFGFVPFYVNPAQRLYIPLSERPEVVKELQAMVRNGGVPVLHGDTHQYRGVTTDDYEFWDDIADRPVKRDSADFAKQRLEDALDESVGVGVYPVTWETPHYAASQTDYQVFHGVFATTYERRMVSTRLGTDQFFPYPLIDIHGQYVIPENMGYLEKTKKNIKDLTSAADAMSVVRDGYASFFFHPFLDPSLLKDVIVYVKKKGFEFVSLNEFPNQVQFHGYAMTQTSSELQLGGTGRYLTEVIINGSGKISSQSTREVSINARLPLKAHLQKGERYVAYRHAFKPMSWWEELVRLAKGDIGLLSRPTNGAFFSKTPLPDQDVKLLWDDAAKGEEAVDQHSFETLLSAVGYDITKISPLQLTDADLGDSALYVIPAAAARLLTPPQIERFYKAVENGVLIFTDGDTPLAKALGFELGQKLPVLEVENRLYPTESLRWPDHPSVSWFERVSEENDQVLFSDLSSRKALMIMRRLGEGKVIASAPLFDPLSGQGYSRFPALPSILANELGVRPWLRRNNGEAYFDPGYRQDISIERLAQTWRRNGIRVIHVAAWHFYDKYSYDYERLVRVAHQNGILVYAWFEWPHVSEHFWKLHPNWREKTATLSDAHLDWRYHMNFQNPDCFKAVMDETKTLLGKLDWDGVNVAEFHFESDDQFRRADRFTPMNAETRRAFEKQAGYDPLDLWKATSPHHYLINPAGMRQLYDFRRTVQSQLFQRILDQLKALNKTKMIPMEIVVTQFDVFGHPELQDRLGIDSASLLNTVKKNGATLQVEDPAPDWALAPQRYLKMGERYSSLMDGHPFMIDINVLPVHAKTQPGFATDTPTGTEFLQLWRYAATHTTRVCVYSESSVSEADWELLPYAMAGDASVEKNGDELRVNSPHAVQVELASPIRNVLLDGKPWPCHDRNNVLVPSGEHLIAFRQRSGWLDTSQLKTQLISLSGELIGAEPHSRGLEIEYKSEMRCSIELNKNIGRIYIDDVLTSLPTVKSLNGYITFLPAGQHRVRFVTGSAILQAWEYFSAVVGSLIVLFGSISSGLLFILYVLIRLHRRTRGIQVRLRRQMLRLSRTEKAHE